MLSGVGILCFSATYLVAFFLELSRFWTKNRGVPFILSVSIILGLVAHSAFLYHHQIALESGKVVSSMQGFFFLASWGLVWIYLYLYWAHPKVAFGLFLLPIALGLILGGTFYANQTLYSPQSIGQIWRSLHGISLIFAVLSVLFGFLNGGMYLLQQYRLKKRITSFSRLKLPSLEWSLKAARGGIGFSTVMLFFGIFSGLLLHHLLRLQGEKSVQFTDPLVVGTLLLFCFLLAFLSVLIFYRPPQQDRAVALLTILSFLFLFSILTFALFSGEAHWGRSAEPGQQNSVANLGKMNKTKAGKKPVLRRIDGGKPLAPSIRRVRLLSGFYSDLPTKL